MTREFEHKSFFERLGGILRLDMRRMFGTPLFYIMLGVAFVIPILVLVMTTMMAGTTTQNPTTGEITEIESFENVWQIIGSTSDAASSGDMAEMMSLTSMCNINMMYLLAAVLVCLFIGDDFRFGYVKNLFARRPSKIDYIISKSLVTFLASAAMLIAFFVGGMLGGAISALPFDAGVSGSEIFMCIMAKVFLMAVFTSLFVLMSVIAKSKVWLSMILSLGSGMLLFNIAPSVTPLDSGIVQLALCLAGGVLVSVGMGAISNIVLEKTDIL